MARRKRTPEERAALVAEFAKQERERQEFRERWQQRYALLRAAEERRRRRRDLVRRLLPFLPHAAV